MFGHYRTTDTNFAGLNQQIAARLNDWPAGPRTLVLANRTEDRRVTRVFARGDFKRPTDPVEPGFPQVLLPATAQLARNSAAMREVPGGGEIPGGADVTDRGPAPAAATRLDLARWIVSPENPLTARVIMNRVWQAYFGQGLVVTAEDFFGTRADCCCILNCRIGWRLSSSARVEPQGDAPADREFRHVPPVFPGHS